MAMFYLLFFVAALCHADATDATTTKPPGPSRQQIAEKEWSELSAWLLAGGAVVHPSLKGGWLQHVGLHGRGLVTKDQLPAQTVLLSIPPKLWIVKDNFPEMWQSALPATGCDKADDVDEQLFKNSASLALEMKHGEKSKWHPWLKLLPKIHDLQQSHPSFVSEEMKTEFAALPVLKQMGEELESRAVSKKCFEAWRKMAYSPIRELSWDEMLHALILVKTRSMTVSGTGQSLRQALIPGVDMMSSVVTSPQDEKDKDPTNTQRHYPSNNMDDFQIKSSQKINAGSELLGKLCDGCDNTHSLFTWGVYLEDNPNEVSAIEMSWESSVECDAKVASARGASLEEVSEASLALEPGWKKAGWLAPRCRESEEDQAPLRCNLARLSWEYCAKNWVAEAELAEKKASLMQVDIDTHGKMVRRHSEPTQ